jgi:hypothetical protein
MTPAQVVMRRTIRFTCDEIRPDGGAIIRRLHGEMPGAPYLNDLAQDARAIIDRVGRPTAVFERIGLDQFEVLYCGSPANQLPAPLPRVARHAVGIALFAATLGPEVEAALADRCRVRTIAGERGMFDAFTAAACERLAQRTADLFAASLPHANVPAFAYLPGSCGWASGGTATVLGMLQPEELGGWTEAAGTPSLCCVAGILLAAPESVHRTNAQFPCCESCSQHRCLYRVPATHTAA